MTNRITRRTAIGSALAAGLAAARAGGAKDSKMNKPAWDSIVVGAGVFGAWTAWHLRKAGQRVLLLDAWGAAHARASSGGESRLTRGSYGSDEIYTRFALDSLASAARVQSFGRGRARRWMTPPLPGFATPLLLPAPLPGD